MFSSYLAWFICNVCDDEFETQVTNVASGTWCPNCKNKTEAKLLTWLKDKCDDVIPQATFDWAICKATNSNYVYDFYLPRVNIIIELDGDQHFRQVLNWKSPESTQQRDVDKMLLALQNGAHFIRIYQDDVYHDRENWENQLWHLIRQGKEALAFLKTKKTMVTDLYKMYEKECSLFC